MQRTVRCGGGQWVAVLCSVEQRVFYFFSLNKETLFFLHTHKPCLLGAERFHHEFPPLSGTSKGLVFGGDSAELHTRCSPQGGGDPREGSGTTPPGLLHPSLFSPAHRLPPRGQTSVLPTQGPSWTLLRLMLLPQSVTHFCWLHLQKMCRSHFLPPAGLQHLFPAFLTGACACPIIPSPHSGRQEPVEM